ncbi:hypothetical protein CMO93_00695 [Candidatus Woesearchaeota archaeon]|nr:hypothetical protein [Candidatus Woesearchaeota archaeon]|tara:strand:- start:2239 stop:3123 length:885 start_codon:yes stop_codon:yes gene_type:complete
MAVIKRRKINNKHYYYLEHRYKVGNKVKGISKYLGRTKPDNIDKLIKDIEIKVMQDKWKSQLIKIKKNYAKELKNLPKKTKKQFLDSFKIEFIYDSNKIEGSSLSYRDTADLFLYGITPKNKPINDVRETEGYELAFREMMNLKNLTLRNICNLHSLIFKQSQSDIAGKIRLHKIMVTGSRVSFPHPENLDELLRDFIKWYNKNKDNYNPVEFAALVHLKFVTIHAFTDGNGRISRLLVNFVLFHGNYPMLNIPYKTRKAYYRSLETSQLWENEKHFLRFFVKLFISKNKNYLA